MISEETWLKPEKLQDAIEALSDDFSSTFTVVEKSQKHVVLANLFAPNEIGEVRNLVKKHFPYATATFKKQQDIAPDYFMWSIDIR